MSSAETSAPGRSVNRWLQLVAGIVCMVMIANLQYGWTYFVDPIDARFHWGRTDIQIAFTIFVATETWLVPIEGWFVDRFGPRIVVMLGGIVVAIAWTMNAYATTLPMLYAAAAVSGVGAGAVYGTCVGNALKWFGDRRGLAAGLTAAGFGAGAAATVVPIVTVIKTYGYDRAFLWFGLGQGLVILVLSQFLKMPKPGEAPKAAKKASQAPRDFRPMEMLRHAAVLDSLRDVRRGRCQRPRGYGAGGADCARLQDREPAGEFPVHRLDRAGDGRHRRQHSQRPGAADVRVGVGSHRAREHDGDRVHLAAPAPTGRSAPSATRRGCSSPPPGWFTSPGARSTACFRRSAPTPTERSTRRPTRGCCTPPRATASFLVPAASWLQSQTGSWHAVFVVAAVANILVGATALFIVKPMRASAQRAALAAMAMNPLANAAK